MGRFLGSGLTNLTQLGHHILHSTRLGPPEHTLYWSFANEHKEPLCVRDAGWLPVGESNFLDNSLTSNIELL